MEVGTSQEVELNFMVFVVSMDLMVKMSMEN